jgi:hypothetical protein
MMTDSDRWRTCDDPAEMMKLLGDKIDTRKLSLFELACCRRLAHLLDSEDLDRILLAEQRSDGLSSRDRPQHEATSLPPDGRRVAAGIVRRATMRYGLASHAIGLAGSAAWAIWFTTHEGEVERWDQERLAQCDMLRCIFGHLHFREVTFAQAWRTPTVTAIARGAYEERIMPAGTLDPSHLAVLADALEDAGCAESVLLDHLRWDRLHIRGCWVVDGLLGANLAVVAAGDQPERIDPF